MVTYFAAKLKATESPTIGDFSDTMVVAITDIYRMVIITHLRVGKCWKLFLATLIPCLCLQLFNELNMRGKCRLVN